MITSIKHLIREKLMTKGIIVFRLPQTKHLSQYEEQYSKKRIKSLDFEQLKIVQNAPLKELQQLDSLIEILKKIGLNNEYIHEFPQHLYPHAGKGLYSWQYPVQFARYLIKLSELKISNYLEIGVRHGGSFLIVIEYLKRFNPDFDKAVGIDIDYSATLDQYVKKRSDIDYKIMDSQSPQFQKMIEPLDFDLVLIDGDHNLAACKNDFILLRKKAKYIAFHDISSIVCPGVCATWMYAKSTCKDFFAFEFIDQYDEVVERTTNSYLGLGLLVNKKYLHENSTH